MLSVAFMPANEMLRRTTGRTPEPEAEQNDQCSTENMTENGEVMRVLVTGEMAPVENRHAADRALGVFGEGNIGQSSYCKYNQY